MARSAASAALFFALCLDAPDALAQQGGEIPRTPCAPAPRAPCPAASDIVAAANAGARASAADAHFQRGRQIHAYEPGALYQLLTSPDRISAILLEAGETITAIAAGDTNLWMVSEIEARAGGAGGAQAIVLVKPLAANARTNIVIATDRRLYQIEAQSGRANAPFTAEIAWTYAVEETSAPPERRLHSFYRIRVVRGRRPSWTPVSVHDDGRQTFIEFPPEAQTSDLPPLFVLGGEGAELVNYRAQRGRYVVDRVFERAELRLGARTQVIVRIERRPAPGGAP